MTRTTGRPSVPEITRAVPTRSDMGPTTVYVCRSGDCRRAKRKRLDACLASAGVRVERVPCQDVCKGAVVGLDVDGRREWFARANGKDAVAALVAFFADGRLRKALRQRRRKSRSGKTRD